MGFLLRGIVLLSLTLPQSAFAAIVINEIAWNGSGGDANNEWIEFYNNGSSSVDVSSWSLVDNGTLSITFPASAGVIAAGSYAVIERTDDGSAPSPAFFIYTGALNNDGRTLTLKRSDGSIEDQVAGGSGWENTGGALGTGETAQRTSLGWKALEATPGAQNGSESIEEEEVIEDTDTEETVLKTAVKSGGSTDPLSPIKTLKITAPAIAYVNQPVTFDVTPSGTGERLVRYRWNFGDGSTAQMKSPEHTFAHAGTYVIVVESRFLKESAMARTDITVLPPMLSLARTEVGDIQIHNNAKYEVDLGQFLLRGEKEFTIPKKTILLPNATLTAHRSLIETGVRGVVNFHDPRGATIVSLLSHERSSTPEEAPLEFEEASTEEMVRIETISDTVPSEPLLEETLLPMVKESLPNPEEPLVYRPTQVASIDEAKTLFDTSRLPYWGILGVFLIGILGVYAKRRENI